MPGSSEVRFTARIPAEVVRRIEAFASTTGISRNTALVEVVRLGLDADTAGVETALQVQAQVKRQLQSLRGLVVACVDAADMAVAASLAHQVNAGVIKPDQIRGQYASIRKALPVFKQMKKQVSASGDDLMDGTIE